MLWAGSSVAQVAVSRPKIFIGTMIDITESKRDQDAVEATRAELARVARVQPLGRPDGVHRPRDQPAFGGHHDEYPRGAALLRQAPLAISMRRGQPLRGSAGTANALPMWSRAFAPCSRETAKIAF